MVVRECPSKLLGAREGISRGVLVVVVGVYTRSLAVRIHRVGMVFAIPLQVLLPARAALPSPAGASSINRTPGAGRVPLSFQLTCRAPRQSLDLSLPRRNSTHIVEPA